MLHGLTAMWRKKGTGIIQITNGGEATTVASSSLRCEPAANRGMTLWECCHWLTWSLVARLKAGEKTPKEMPPARTMARPL